MKMICPKCDIEYEEGNHFCSKCGSKLVINKAYILEQEELEKEKQRERLEQEEKRKEYEMVRAALSDFYSLYEQYESLLKGYEKYTYAVDYPKDRKLLGGFTPHYLSRRFYMRDNYKQQLAEIQKYRGYVEEFLHYAAFYKTTKDIVVKELLALSNELNTLFKEFNGYPKLLDKFLEKNKHYRNSDIFYRQAKKILDVAKALLEGGKFSLTAEKQYMKYMSPVTDITHYTFEHKYAISNRLQINIKNEKDDLKAGIFAINIRGELLVLINALKHLKDGISFFNASSFPPGFESAIYIDGFSAATLINRYVETIKR